MCIGSKLRNLNGRKPGDNSAGYLTCHKYNGQNGIPFVLSSYMYTGFQKFCNCFLKKLN